MSKPQIQVPAAQVASRLGVSRDTAIRMIQRGELEGEQTLTRWWATGASVKRYEVCHKTEIAAAKADIA